MGMWYQKALKGWSGFSFVGIVWLFSSGLSLAQSSPWMNTALTPEQRADLLVSQMTLDEKIAMVHGVAGQYVGNGTNNARLGIPALHLQDGPAGVADGVQNVTALPAPIALAASWDLALARQYGALAGAEARGKGVHVSLGPMINLVRVPQGGRAFETFGEDPFLSAVMAAAHIQGIQSQGVIANAKHFICNDQEYTRGNENSLVDERTMQEIYAPPFLAAVRAGVGSVCSAYNMINGAWSSETPLLNSLLKGSWGFKGFVECDWGGNFETDPAANNGLDLEMPNGSRFGVPLRNSVLAGTVPSAQLDKMVGRILAAMFRFQIFDNPTTGAWSSSVSSAAHTQFARDAAAQGIVLLKNSGSLLPLNTSTVRSIAVLGSVASLEPIWTGAGSAQVYPPYYNSPLNGISNRAGSAITISYNQGDSGHTNEAAQLARQSDIAIVCVGEQTSEGLDRTNLFLPGDQDALVRAVAAANPKTIVVLYEGAGTVMSWAADVPAILSAWYPGQEGSAALASILFGDVNPSAKLPVTFPFATNQVPANTAAQYPGINLRVNYSERLLMGYRWYDAGTITPLFPFGHGLSYSSFAYTNLTIGRVTASGTVAIGLDVRNTGTRSGSEIVQLYLGFPSAAGEPPRQLKGFKKIPLAAGQTGHASFNLNWEDLACFETNSHTWQIPVGTFQVMIGSSSRDIRLTGSFSVSSPISSSGLGNAALFQPASASSSLDAAHSPLAAVDGDPATAWTTTAGMPQWISVDLGARIDFNRVRLSWGANYAQNYQIQTSDNGTNWLTVYSTALGSGGNEEILCRGLGRFVALSASQAANSAGLTLQDFSVFRAEGPQHTNNPDVVWVEDGLPAGAVAGSDGGDSWTWSGTNPAPFSGSLDSPSAVAAGPHQHYFYGATSTLTINSNDTLFAYVYLDPANVPSEIMLQWNNGSWEHRAYWGSNLISYGADAPPSRCYMGQLPAAGGWFRLEVPAARVRLEGSVLSGLAFSCFGGRATWDCAGTSHTGAALPPPPPPPPPRDVQPPTVSLLGPTNNAVVSGTNVTISASATDDVGVATIQFKLDGTNLGPVDATAPYTINWNTTAATNGPHQLFAVATDTSGNQATSSIVTITLSNNIVSNTVPDVVWVEDNLPAGAILGTDGGDSWNWVNNNPAPFSGALANQSTIAPGLHQHFFYGATSTLGVNSNDVLVAYVFLDPANPPAEIMLQWNDGNWQHRAYWGTNGIGYGLDATVARHYMGSLPPTGQWTRLLVPAAAVGLGANPVNGLAFSLFNGRATWDHAGKAGTGSVTNNPPPDTSPPTVSITSPANNAILSGASVSLSATAADNVAVARVQFRLDGSALGAPDLTAPYGMNWDTTTTTNGPHQLSAVATDTSGNQATSAVVTITVNNTITNSSPDVIWVEDALPAGAVPGAEGGDSWTWVNANPTAYSGASANQSTIGPGLHQHYFYSASATLPVGSNDTLLAYVFLDPVNVPTEIMLQWNDGTWEHRAFWGADQINYGIAGTPGRRYMGPLPAAGTWVRLAVPGVQVGLTGNPLNGMAFSQFGGRATWDYAGKAGSGTVTNNPPQDAVPPTVMITAPANGATVTGTNIIVSATATDNVAVARVQFRLDGANLGGADSNAPYSVSWNTSAVSNGVHQLSAVATDTAGNQATSANITVTVSNALATNSAPDYVWVEDDLPSGAIPGTDGGDAWTWINNNPPPFSGALANQSAIAPGLHQHYFYGASRALTVNSNDTLVAYVYLDPANIPSEVMLQWNDGNWQHRAYWGTNGIDYGLDGTTARRYMGPVPPAGQWTRLLVPASAVGLGANPINGMAFSLFDGRATWDHAGKAGTGSATNNPPPADTAPPTVSIIAPANNSVVSGASVTLSANASDNVAVAKVQFRLDGANLNAPITSNPYSTTWDTTTVSNGQHFLTALATDTAGNQADSAILTVMVSNSLPDIIWVEDSLPDGAILGVDGDDSWTWLNNNPAPFSGGLAHQSNLASGLHQHFFYGIANPFPVDPGDTLVAYVFIDPANPPAEIMLQWNDGDWQHRAYWGINGIDYGIDGTTGRQYMGPVPAAGQWTRLMIPANAVGLRANPVNGMAFSLYDGRASWDHAGKVSGH
jgi:beta-glucosidase